MSHIKRIFIIGHMGALKAGTAETLAKKLNWQFIDANPSLERYIGRSLQEILGKVGEAAFHLCEGEIIAHYLKQEHVVVVLEEAVVVAKENRTLLASECVVYLKVSTAEQLARFQSGRTPLLPIADIKAFLDQQHLERDSLYEEVATITVNSSAFEENADRIINALA